MECAKLLKERISRGDLTLGLLATNHLWLELVEVARNAGLDYLIIDEEHGVFDGELVVQVCSLARLINFPVLIRPQDTECALVRRAADKGPCGFLLPCVETAAQMDQVSQALYMPPDGRRRPGGMGVRWVKDFHRSTWRDEVERDWIVLPQIETCRGLENVGEIARHPMTTAIAVGPYDLAADLGVCNGDPNDPKLLGAIERVRQAGRDAGKNMWVIGDADEMIRRGFTFICVGEPVWILEGVLRQRVAAWRNGPRGVHQASRTGCPQGQGLRKKA